MKAQFKILGAIVALFFGVQLAAVSQAHAMGGSCPSYQVSSPAPSCGGGGFGGCSGNSSGGGGLFGGIGSIFGGIGNLVSGVVNGVGGLFGNIGSGIGGMLGGITGSNGGATSACAASNYSCLSNSQRYVPRDVSNINNGCGYNNGCMCGCFGCSVAPRYPRQDYYGPTVNQQYFGTQTSVQNPSLLTPAVGSVNPVTVTSGSVAQ